MTSFSIKEIDFILDRKIEEIFLGKDIKILSNYEKRRLVFEYVCQNGQYNFELLKKIKDKNTSRDLYEELHAALNEKEAICSALSQYYKLLLDKLEIYSACICTNDGSTVPHQLNIVKNDDGTYSFDDVTNGIIHKDSIDTYFNYDIASANSLGQGLSNIDGTSQKWIIISIIYFMLGISISPYLKYGIESPDGFSYTLPQIKSFNNNKHNKKD